MAKANNPTNLSRAFSISHTKLDSAGVLDVTLAIDTRLFIDPLLLSRSRHPEMVDAATTYKQHFENIIALLKASKREEDAAWKAAKKQLSFPEISGTCLGYGAGSIHGSGFGGKLSARILTLAAEIIDIGIEAPELFPAMALFEPDIGPDRISDMTTNIVFPDLARFNARVIKSLGLPAEKFIIGAKTYTFVVNPFESKRSPVVLVPSDVLRDLPVAQDWDDIADASAQNDEIREAVNTHIGEIWAAKSKRDKAALKQQVLAGQEAFETLLAAIGQTPHNAYPVGADPEGLTAWASAGLDAAEKNPIAIAKPVAPTADELKKVVLKIVEQFRHLVESCGLNKDLYRASGGPRHESTSQRVFFAVAYAYCKANNIDVSPEIDTGNGKIDFKFSHGFDKRVLVEIKLSTNSGAVSGYNTQLEVYKQSQETVHAIYLVIDVGKMGNKDTKLLKAKNDAVSRGDPVSDLEFVDAILKPSASKRKP